MSDDFELDLSQIENELIVQPVPPTSVAPMAAMVNLGQNQHVVGQHHGAQASSSQVPQVQGSTNSSSNGAANSSLSAAEASNGSQHPNSRATAFANQPAQ